MNFSKLNIRIGSMICAFIAGAVLLPNAWCSDSSPQPAVGFPSRDPHLDVLPGFQNPPLGYGEVAFYWWLGDPLTKERLSWQIDRLKEKDVLGLQVNYAHSDQGGQIYGLTLPSDPPLFSEDWWNLFGWFLQEAKKRDMSVSLSDYTLGVGQGSYMDEILKDCPDLRGATLSQETRTIDGGKELTWEVPDNAIAVTAYRIKEGAIESGSGVDLRAQIFGKTLRWTPPDAESWQVVAVKYTVNPYSVDPLNQKLGEQVIEKFFQRFVDRNPGEAGKGLNFFFSDELDFRVGGNLWTARFADEFKKRKGYDVVPELPALFVDIGPKTPKIRLDFRDVMVSLEEESFFRPVFEWHNQHGMLYGCDHGGRGLQVDEFGDYFRTQRWMTGPGCDQPHLDANIIKNKVASSITHLYERPRTWLEGYHSSGWGTNLEQLTAATMRNFAMGQNLLTLHGLYYSIHGGWWEWAPPCNHFRMPYWEHMGDYMDMVQRLSYLLSQGRHRCDVAILYPVAPVESGMGGQEAVKAAFQLGESLYKKGIDFDFIDFQSVDRAKIENKQLAVSGEIYKVLVLPAMKAIRFSALRKAADFQNQGGIVISVGALPEASERIGRDDLALDALVKGIFSLSARESAGVQEIRKHGNKFGGLGIWAQKPEQALAEIASLFPRDFTPASDNVDVMHRKIGARDIYMVYGAAKNSECEFRAKGRVELWNPWSGEVKPLPNIFQTVNGTRVRMPLEASEAQIVVFNPGDPGVQIEKTNLDEIVQIGDASGKTVLTGYAETPGEKTASVIINSQTLELRGSIENPKQKVALDGDWRFELKPTMDNQWGDFRWPPFPGLIGAEARRLRFAWDSPETANCQEPNFDDSKWPMETTSFGPQFWKLGPLPEDADAAAVEKQLLALQQIDPKTPIEIGGKTYAWTPYEFSWRWGMENDAGHQGWHGLKEDVHDEFIGLGKLNSQMPKPHYEKEEAGTLYYLWTSVYSADPQDAFALCDGVKPARAWLNGQALGQSPAERVTLKSGANPLLLCYAEPGRGYFVIDSKYDSMKLKPAPDKYKPLAMSWYTNPGVLRFDVCPQTAQPVGWYRFSSPPGLRSLTLSVRGKALVWADGKELPLEKIGDARDGAPKSKAVVPDPKPGSVEVAIRVEAERGWYGGAAFSEPIALDCGEGTIALGDWSQIDGLACYSGGAWYRKNVQLAETQIAGRTILNLGNLIASVEVWVNGQKVGVRVAPPWKFDISPFVKAGDNRIEALVYNTLSNHYLTIPTNYRGSLVSGLLGPVNLEIYQPAQLSVAQ